MAAYCTQYDLKSNQFMIHYNSPVYHYRGLRYQFCCNSTFLLFSTTIQIVVVIAMPFTAQKAKNGNLGFH